MRFAGFLLAVGLLVATVAPGAAGDELRLRNGDLITGYIVSMNDEHVVVRTTYGELTIDRAEILTGTFEATVAPPSEQLDINLGFDEGSTEPMMPGAEFLDHNTLRGPGADGGSRSAVRSTGAGQYLEISGVQSLDSATDVTLSFWILLEDAARLQYILSKWDAADGNEADGKFAVGTRYSSLYIYLVDPDGVYHYQSYEDVIPIHEWTHVAIVFEKGLLSVYKDGAIAGQEDLAFDELRANSSPLYVLTAKANTDNPWSYYNVNGSLDGLRIYSRALSAAEIEAVYEGT